MSVFGNVAAMKTAGDMVKFARSVITAVDTIHACNKELQAYVQHSGASLPGDLLSIIASLDRAIDAL